MKMKSICAAIALSFSVTLPAAASVVMNISEQGSDVVVTYDGSLDLTGMSPTGTGMTEQLALAGSSRWGDDNDDHIVAVGAVQNWDYLIISEYSLSGSIFSADGDVRNGIQSGDDFAFESRILDGRQPWLFLAFSHGYVSGDAISGSITFSNQTFASMNLINGGVLDINWGADSIRVNVGSTPAPVAAFAAVDTTPVPLPASLPLVLGGLGLLGLTRRRK